MNRPASNGTQGTSAPPPTAKPMEAESIAVMKRDIHGATLLFKTPDDSELTAAVVRLERFLVVFETHQPEIWLHASQLLKELRLFLGGELVYSGRGVIRNVLNTGAVSVCEVNLDEPGIANPIKTPDNGSASVQTAYAAHFARWQQQARVLPEFKAVVLDLQNYLFELKLLAEHIEIAIQNHPAPDRPRVELQVAQDLAPRVLATIDTLHERFEELAAAIPAEQLPAHQLLVRRQLHSLFLCAPFGYRTYHKPLGYAGDYEIMNMIHRNTFEGASLYAKLVHFWLVSQWASKSVRNRIAHMQSRLIKETARVQRRHRRIRVLNVGCGPAREIQNFLAEQPLSSQADFVLLDFDEETIQFARTQLLGAKARHARHTGIKFHQMSVMKLIAGSQRATNPLGGDFDLIYCGGLFDYFSDLACRQLVEQFYKWLAPEGLVVVANMSNHTKPFSRMVEFLLDWHLIYRDARCMAGLAPVGLQLDNSSVVIEPSLVNLFLELRKPPAN
ncbi:MAG: class I SAM-dependent methyltransferase [Verrucomicrobiota bacterium]|jgi:extracellular factor (EF) 3-hydroxypalmitic acid methyl ester biosynthesis protein